MTHFMDDMKSDIDSRSGIYIAFLSYVCVKSIEYTEVIFKWIYC